MHHPAGSRSANSTTSRTVQNNVTADPTAPFATSRRSWVVSCISGVSACRGLAAHHGRECAAHHPHKTAGGRPAPVALLPLRIELRQSALAWTARRGTAAEAARSRSATIRDMAGPTCHPSRMLSALWAALKRNQALAVANAQGAPSGQSASTSKADGIAARPEAGRGIERPSSASSVPFAPASGKTSKCPGSV